MSWRRQPSPPRGPGCLLAFVVLCAAAATAYAVDPTAYAIFGTVGSTDGPRAISVPSLTFGSPITVEFWVKISREQVLGARIVDFGKPEDGTKADVASLQIAFCPSSEGATCGNVASGKTALRVSIYGGPLMTALLSQFVLFTGSDGVPVGGAWSHVAITWSDAATKEARAYLNGVLVGSPAVTEAVPATERTRNFIGSPLEWVDPRATEVSLADFRLWSVTRTAGEISGNMAATTAISSASLVLRYKLDQCGTTGAVDTSNNANHGSLIDDVAFSCTSAASPALLPKPSIVAAAATSPTSVSATIAFTSGQGVAAVEIRCSGFGGPAVARLAATDADSAGLYTTVAVAASYGDAYPLSCTALVRKSDGTVSLPSDATTVTVPAGASLSAQAALMPAGNPLASNTFLRVGTPVASDETVSIAFAAPLPNYILGQRAASHRVGLITRTRQDYFYCDYDLDSCRCTIVRQLNAAAANSLGDSRPVDFSYTSMSPWPAKDPDARFSAQDVASAAADWPWSAEAYANRSDLVGPLVADVLQPPASCASYACYTYAAQRWASYAYSGCNPTGYGPIRPWPPELCAGAGAYDFMAFARNFSHDFRHYYSAYERTFYDSASGLSSATASETYEWSGLLGTFHLYTPTPTGESRDVTQYKKRNFRLQPELLNYAWARPDVDPETASSDGDLAYGPQYMLGTTNCLDFYDYETDAAARTYEGGETSGDVQRAYAASYSGLLLQDQRYFSFWQRGAAFFGSFATYGPAGVVPLIKACALRMGVALLKFDLAALAPAGTTYATGTIYKRIPWPGADGSAFADSFPPAASIQAMATDGRVEAGGPLLYHAIVRVPFFPSTPASCPSPLVGGVICPGLSVTSVTAMLTWRVDPSAFSSRAVSAGVSSLSTYQTGVVLHETPKVLRTDAVPLSDHWIVMNERPLHAGGGYGYLEGRWVDPPNSRFSFYVTGDKVIRVRKANGYQSGIAGTVDAELRIYGNSTWRASQNEWTSVAAAAYKDGTLYVVREVHTPDNTRVFTLASETATRPRFVSSKRLKRSNERAPSSQLVRITGVDAASFAAPAVNYSVVVPKFPANVISAHVVDDYSSGKMMETDPSLAFAELPWVIFVISDPPMVIKLHTRCPPGYRWNWEAAVFNRSVSNADLCINLPAGRYSTSEGLLLDEDAALCPAGTFSLAASTNCTTCQKGTYADGGAASCYDCPQHTYSKFDGMPCTACPPERFTTAAKWTFDCALCLPGSYLPRTGDSNCLTCPSNAWSTYGALGNCSYCPAGQYPTSDLSGCAKCKAGEYQPTENTPCIACPPGQWSTEGTFGNCSVCLDGKVVTDKQDGCRWCSLGYYVPDGEVSCFLCPADKASSGGEGCRKCAPGYISPDDRQECRPCPVGTYEDESVSPGECTTCPLNTVASFTNSTRCVACAPGFVSSPDSALCQACNPGTYRSANNASCEPVPQGAVAPTGSGAYIPCVNGTVPNTARSECVKCSKGTYKVGYECQRCPLNTYAPNEASEACAPCPAGYIAAADSQSCIICAAGTYRSLNMSACDPVPLGSAAPEGSGRHYVCSNGTVANPSRSECVKCPKGTFNVDYDCQRCSLNEVAEAEGSVACRPCAAGEISAADFQTCIPCPGGTYRAADMATCEPVPARSVAFERASIYTNCTPGTVPNTLKTECTPCRKGTYDLDGICRNCPLNTVSSAEQATVCSPCPAGTVATADLQTCVPCGVGTYRSLNMTNCTPVPSRAVALEGSAMYTACPNGSIANGAKSECIPCRAGSYQYGELCLQCPLNQANPRVNQTACSPCAEGYVAAADSQTCVPCLGGYYRYEGLPVCYRVPAGGVAVPGSRNFTMCQRGWVPNQESTSCSACEKGTYESDWSCRDCMGNTHQPEVGKTSCIECGAGTVASEDRQKCDPCPSGSFRNASMTYCQLCPFTTYANAPSATVCQPCRNGTQSSDDRTDCELCLAGFFEQNGTCIACSDGSISAIGSTACKSCGGGSISNSDRTECIQCPGGTYKAAGTNVCLPCLTGSWSPPGTADECKSCPLGWYAAPDATKCLPCDSGTYMKNGTVVCVQCPSAMYAPNEGTAARCQDCSPGYVSSPDFRSCTPCGLGFHRPNATNTTAYTTCIPCPVATVARTPGSFVCELCPAGKVPREDRADCRNCPAGLYPVRGFCALCPAKHISASGDANCTLCPAGEVATADRTVCEPCPSSMYLPPNSEVCLKCPRNTISNPGSVGCTACNDGDVSDEGQTFCKPCAKGTFRNASMSYCEPCPSGTYAASASSAACLACSETQLCPVATSQPLEIPFYKGIVSSRIASVQAATTTTSKTARALLVVNGTYGRRRLLQQGDFGVNARDDSAVDYLQEDYEYDTNTGTITRAEIKTEEVAVKRVYRIMALLAAATGGVLLLAALAIFVYVRLLPGGDEARALRAARVAKLDFLYKDVVTEKREEAAKKEAEAAAARQGKGLAVDSTGKELGPAKAAPEDEDEDEDEEPQGSVTGAVFALIGLGLVFVAMAFVLLQYALANYQIIQTLVPGASPSAADILGAFEVGASFLGYTGDCTLRDAKTVGLTDEEFSGVYVTVTAIQALDGSPAPVATTFFNESAMSCMVSWKCTSCKLSAATNVSVNFRLVSRLAFAVAVNYYVKVPTYLTIQGVVTTRADGLFTVLRGPTPVALPVALTPLHFDDKRDGSARYDVSIRPADNRLAERTDDAFGLCSLTLPLSAAACAGEVVAFQAGFTVSSVYTEVSRVIKASFLDMLADLASLATAALGVGGQLVVVYFMSFSLSDRFKGGLRRQPPPEPAEEIGPTEDERHAKSLRASFRRKSAPDGGPVTPTGGRSPSFRTNPGGASPVPGSPRSISRSASPGGTGGRASPRPAPVLDAAPGSGPVQMTDRRDLTHPVYEKLSR